MRTTMPCKPQFSTAFPVLLLFLLSCLFLVNGCAFIGLGKSEAVVSLSDLKLQEIKAMETIFMLDLRVMNSEDAPMKIRGLNCELKINGELFATGVNDGQTEIPAFGSATIQVPVYSSNYDMVSTVIELLQNGGEQRPDDVKRPLQYELSGRIRLDKLLRNTIDFQAAGQLSQD